MKLIASVGFLLVLIHCAQLGFADRILGLFTSTSKSHLIIHMAVVKSLIERGHNVTVVTTLPLDNKEKNYRHIHVEVPEMPREQMKKAMSHTSGPLAMLNRLQMVQREMAFIHNNALQHPKMQDLMQTESFDLLILGYFFNDFQLGVAAHFKCPVVINWMVAPIPHLGNYMGQPMEPLYVPHLFSGGKPPLGYLERIKSILFNAFDGYMNYGLKNLMAEYYEKNFPSPKYPSFEEMRKNVSLLLVNHHFSEGLITPLVPAVVQIGGIQVKDKPSPLPEDIKKFLNEANNGAIYFSLGSNIHSAEMKPETIEIIYKVLSGLKQKVLWKWETDATPGNASNILFKKWLPQDDILAHPNLRLFISHGGKGSVVESQYHGVPLIGMPLFGDQISNSELVEKSGFGLHLNFQNVTENTLKNAIAEILQNPKYRENVKRFAKVYRDRPMSAKDTAVYWIEYVIRHKGAKHMQSPAVHMSFIQYYGLDIIAMAVVLWHVFTKLLKIVVKKVVCKVMKLKCKKNIDKKKKSQ